MIDSEIDAAYEERYYNFLQPTAQKLERLIGELIADSPRIDTVSARAKSIDRFCAKAKKTESGTLKYSDPLSQIQDQIGARIVTFYKDDVERIAVAVEEYFRAIEVQQIVPDTDSEFGYFGKHLILLLPEDVLDSEVDSPIPFFELQIKTLFQHAWSEANHDLAYKANQDLSTLTRRKVAFTAAQAWGADNIFNELHNECNS